MESGKHALPLTGLMLALGLVASTYLIGNVIRDVRLAEQIIKVRGYAETYVESDLAIWRVSFGIRTQDIPQGHVSLEQQRDLVNAYLAENGIAPEAVFTRPVTVTEIMGRDAEGRQTNVIEHYEINQSLEITSSDVHKIRLLATDISMLVGILPSSPRFMYTKVNDLKEQLLTEATRDARMRAETLATGSGVRLGVLRAARQGVFAVRAENDSAIAADSDSASDDTSSIMKKVTAVVTVDYSMK